MEKSIAVVVTYNRLGLLTECIDALRRQSHPLDAILVVNNGSTDDTEDWLKQQPDLHYISQKNIGSSGGFNTGINWAYKNGYSWIWCMDDDGYPKFNAFEKLLEPETEHLALRNCAVINKADKKSFVWKTGSYASIDEVKEPMIKGIGHPFNGTLLHRNIVERVGVPKPKLFLWGDETEYYYRITRQNNIPVYTITQSIHYHPAAAFSYKRDWDYESAWKMYYYVRNRFDIHKAKFGIPFIALFHYCCFLMAMMGVVMFYQKTDRFKKLQFIMWPAYDAFTNNYSATPQTILSRLKLQPLQPTIQSMHKSIQQIWANLLAPLTVFREEGTANA